MSGLPFWLAVVMTACNAVKPVVIDDTPYLLLARQMAQTPLEPYGPPPGFLLNWYQNAEPAFEILMPPVLPYWLSLGILCFGESIPLLKLCLFPFAWLFTSAIGFFLQRFCPGARRELLIVTAMSPTFLPSMNLMLDIPALALSLTGLRLFWTAETWRGIVASGVVAGLAMQTKYTAFCGPALILLLGWQSRCLKQALGVLAIAGLVFFAWEGRMKLVYGHSHFFYHSKVQREIIRQMQEAERGHEIVDFTEKIDALVDEKSKLFSPLVGNLGGLFPVVALVGGLALGCPRRFINIGICLVVAHYLSLLLLPESVYVLWGGPGPDDPRFTFNSLFATAFGISSLLAMGGCAIRLLRLRGEGDDRWLDRLPILWLLLEIACYFALTPFGASRRLMGIVIAGTMVCGRCLERRETARDCKRTLRHLAILSCFTGFFYAATDWADAFVEQYAIEDAKAWIDVHDRARRTIWFAGHWGTQWYGNAIGMREIWPGISEAKTGDWIVLPHDDARIARQEIEVDLKMKLMAKIAVRRLPFGLTQTDWLPLPTTNPLYYCGSLSISRMTGPRLELLIYRVGEPMVLKSRR